MSVSVGGGAVPPRPRPGAELRALRRRRSAAEIERAALELFVERGFELVSVDDIAAAVNISRRTFFRYFPSKDAVLLGDPRLDEDLLVRAFEAQPAGVSTVAALHAALRVLADEHGADATTTMLRARVLDDAPAAMAAAFTARQHFQHRLTPLVAARLGVDPGVDMRPALVVQVSLAAMYVGIWHWLHTGAQEPLDRVVGEALLGAATGLDSIVEVRSGN